MKELLVSLLMYAGQHSGLQYSADELPMIQFVSSTQLVSLQYQGDVPSGFDYQHSGTVGLYNHQDDTIYLSHTIDEQSIYGKSILVHELVHYLQYRNNRYTTVECTEKLEPLAYTLQNQYLHDHGLQASFSKKHIFFASLCPESQ